jgi:hypothetical protein
MEKRVRGIGELIGDDSLAILRIVGVFLQS